MTAAALAGRGASCGPGRWAAAAFALLLVAVGAGCGLRAPRPPTASLPAAINLLGRRATFDIDVRGAPPGLRSATVRLQTADTAVDLAREEYPVAGWFSRSLTHTRLHVAADLAQLHVPEGAATLEVFVTAYGGDGGPSLALSAPVTVDLTAPQIELLTTRHRVRLGGADVAVFRQSPDTAESGIAVEQYFFPAATGYFADPTIAVAFFAIPERLSTNAEPHLTARDAAGNRSDLTLRCRIEPRTFEERTLALDEDYLGRKVPEIEHAARLRARGDLLERYLRLNRDLRQRNEERIRELTTASEPQPLWDGRFHIPPHTAMTASFANRRAYTYRGAVVDRQTHLGIDLAAPEGSPIEAVQRGVVVYAGDLGIYGGTVVLDHGLGIFSLYGHLGAIAVRPGEPVMAGQYLGQMGQTGLASGPHLHFSIMVHGVHVDPTEWLNPAWLGRYINPKLALLPLAATRTAAQPADRTR